MNQLLALQAKQSIQTQRLQITQTGPPTELARQAAATERRTRRRAASRVKMYTPQPVNFYNR